MKTKKSSLWVEKYRFDDLDEIVLTDANYEYFHNLLRVKKDIPHILFSGTAGIGKTLLGKICAAELDCDFLYINASLEKGIDLVRDKITTFASTSSTNIFSESSVKKIIFLDEAERLVTAQDALKVFLEQYEHNCRFILATNNISKIIDPLRNRCQEIQLIPSIPEERSKYAIKCLNLLKKILDNEKVTYDNKALVELVKRYFPSLRKCISILQQFTNTYGDSIDDRILNLSIGLSDDLIKAIKAKDILKLRKIASNTDSNQFFRDFYENFDKYILDKDYIRCSLIIGKYTYQDSNCVDAEINLFTCFVELLGLELR